jgi:hypothetical protein
VIQLALFPLPPAPEQLGLELTFSTTTSTPKGPTMTTSTPQRPGALRRFLARLTRPKGFGSSARPFPSSTPALTPDDWRVIRLALQRAVVEHTAADRWPAAEATQRTLDKVAHR